MIANQQRVKLNQVDSLTSRQSEILTGLLLGDGHLETQNGGITYRLKVEHSDVQADYAEWLFREFKNLCDCSDVYRRERKDGRVSIGFTTKSSNLFRQHAKQFYVDRQKRIPPLLDWLLKPLGLAIWFMDDGSRKSARHKTYNIHTLGYKRYDLLRVQEVLKKSFDIYTALHRQRNNSWRIYIPSSSAECFKQIVLPYVTPIQSMHKKLAE